uniref:Ig-like domain-containing protein n=1 Tax=Periophthalmus magnuspinnatus TaxID=409849 RepID=A0A3B4B964_9GOBI
MLLLLQYCNDKLGMCKSILSFLSFFLFCKVHTLRYFHTSSQVPNFPEFVSVGYLDDLQITHFDSVTRKYVPKQEWMKKITEEDPQFWERNRQLALGNEQVGKSQIKTVKRRLNVTEGVHFVQFMTGCDWDDETGDITGYYQHAFDGEDFISLDFDTETFVAPKDEAFITKLKWERMGEAARQKNYITGDCVKYLKKHVRNGGSALKRTELPLVSMLQKSSSAPVTCHATGFYPSRARLFWTKDGEELLEDVDPGEILPNEDETFQTSVSLDPSSVPSKDWDRYHCVFQLSGDKNKYVTRLDRSKIRINAPPLTLVPPLTLLHPVPPLRPVPTSFLVLKYATLLSRSQSVW